MSSPCHLFCLVIPGVSKNDMGVIVARDGQFCQFHVATNLLQPAKSPFGEGVIRNCILVSVKGPDRDIFNAVFVSERVERARTGDGGRKSFGMLVDGVERTDTPHGMSDAINPVCVNVVFCCQFRIDKSVLSG